MSLRPDPHGTIRAVVSHSLVPGETPLRDVREADRLPELRRRVAHAGGQVGRVLAGIEAGDDVYAETLAGDAAHCAGPVTGRGTTLALVGAYVLAGEVSRAATVEEGLAAYERRLRPFVERAQKLPPGVPRIANPLSENGVRVMSAVLRVAGTAPARWVAGRLSGGEKDEFELPEYAV